MRHILVIFFVLGLAFNAKANPYFYFGKCLDKGYSQDECNRMEAQRYVKEIEDIYAKYAQDKYFDNFLMQNAQTNPEKFKKLLNIWKVYVQNYCNLIAYANKEMGSPDEARNECLYQQASRQFEEIQAVESIRESDTY